MESRSNLFWTLIFVALQIKISLLFIFKFAFSVWVIVVLDYHKIVYRDLEDCLHVLSSSPDGLLILSPWFAIKVPANEDTLLQTHCSPWCFLGCVNWEHLLRIQNVSELTKSETLFLFLTRNLCPEQMLGAGANGQTSVSATMCPRCQGLKSLWSLAIGAFWSHQGWWSPTVFFSHRKF